MNGQSLTGQVAVQADGQTARSAWGAFLHRHPGLRALSTYSTAVYSGQVLALVRAFWLAGFLGPAAFGLWRLLRLVLAYLSRVGEANEHAIRRELPEAVGAGHHDRAETIARSMISTQFLVGIGISGCCALAAAVVPRWWPAVPSWGWLALALLAPLQLLYETMVITLHAREHVKRYSWITISFAVIATLTIPLGALWAGVHGALCGLMLSYLGPLAWMARCGEVPRLGLPQWSTVRPLWAVGVPLWVTWIPIWILSDIDQWLVAVHLGTSALGLYGIAVALGIMLRFIPKVYRVVYQPFLLRRLGATKNWGSLRPYFVQSLRLFACATPIAVAALFFLSDAVGVLLPAYREVIPAVKVYSLAAFWCLLPPVTFMVCVAAKRTRRWCLQTLIVLGAHILVTSLVLREGGGLMGAAACRGAAYTVYTAAQIQLALSFFGARGQQWLSLFGSMVRPFLMCVVVCVGLELLWPLPTDASGAVAATVGRLVIATGLMGLQYYLANRRWGFSSVFTAPTGIAGEIGDEIPETAAEAA